ncbi:MAG: D-glucuronyl C5-epimerase family protein [Candidatus Marinimicrobia bacterium]|nr:D-glucuronyl C5-epimerase family protein [Candidatus Neomarinimicrobiota bacterium]
MTGRKNYFVLAEKALLPFSLAVEQGWVTVFTPWGPFYEEYTASVPTLVLNGMIVLSLGYMIL